MFRRRVSMTSYVGRCRECRRVIIGQGQMSTVEYYELTYKGVASSNVHKLGKRVLWHKHCLQR